MGFVTPALLGGALLVGLPILLHLIMRREAQHLKFPALRFVQRRQSLNQHRLRLRHWLLLALRCVVIALLAFALARPTLRGSGLAGREDQPIATALVFDNSLRMAYRHENQTRLERSRDLASWVVEQLPPEGRIAIVDRGGQHRAQLVDRDGAELRIERLETHPGVRPLAEALRDAADWVEGQTDHRGEIYVFTDLAAGAWPPELLESFAERLEELPGTNVYLIDVGVAQPRNVGLAGLRLSREQLTPGSLLKIETELVVAGPATGAAREPAAGLTATPPAEEPAADDVTGSNQDVDAATSGVDATIVELYVADAANEPQKRGQESLSGPGDRPQRIEFTLSGLDVGTHQGFVRIAGSDALPHDDVRFFTVDVRPPRRVLIVGGTQEETLFLREALAPSTAAGRVPSKFDCQTARYPSLGELPLPEFDAICLIDPPPLPAEAWRSLVDYVQQGGGVGVFLGRQARREEFNAGEPQQLLPARLRWQSRDETFLRPLAVEHPALAELRDFADIAPWSEFPVFKFWELEPGAAQAHVVAGYANGQPALVERQIGAGRVLMMTTSISDPAHRDPWNLLPTGPDPWPFLVLATSLAEYLTGVGEARLNYLAGQTAILPLEPEERVASYVLQMPGDTAVRQSIAPGQQDIAVAATDAPGNYRVRAGGQQGQLDRGFSVNVEPELSRLERINPAQIIAALGEGRVRVARTREEIEVRVGLGRVGRELFPMLIVAVALVLGAEQLLANRFYRAA